MEKLSLGTNKIEVPPTDGQMGCGLASFVVMGMFGSLGLMGIFSESAADKQSGLITLGVAVAMSSLTMALAPRYQYHHPDTVEILQKRLDECLASLDQNSQMEIKRYIERTKEDNQLGGKEEDLTIKQWQALDYKLQGFEPISAPSHYQDLTP